MISNVHGVGKRRDMHGLRRMPECLPSRGFSDVGDQIRSLSDSRMRFLRELCRGLSLEFDNDPRDVSCRGLWPIKRGCWQHPLFIVVSFSELMTERTLTSSEYKAPSILCHRASSTQICIPACRQTSEWNLQPMPGHRTRS